jgi:hypothetical protein
MTFEEKINRANQNTGKGFHIFAEYNDGSRGYYTSRGTLDEAKRFADKLVEPIVYDRDGNEVYYP